MNGRPGRPGTPGGGPSRQSGGRGPGGSRRPGGPESNDNVLPLITGVLGSSILAFSLYVFSQNPGLLGDIVHGDDNGPCNHCVETSETASCSETYQPASEDYQPACESYQPDGEARQPLIHAYHMSREASQPAVKEESANPGPKISIEKKKWLTDREEETIKERRLKEKQERGKLQKELSEHLQKVKEIRDELHKEKKSKYPWE